MKKVFKISALIIIFLLLFFFTEWFLRYILIDDSKSYTRITYHEMYEQDNIDILFIGSSHCYRGFYPTIIDNELNLNSFNAGSSDQSLDGSYMLLKEANRYNNIQHVYLEVYYKQAYYYKKGRTTPTSTYIISDYLRPSLDKIVYLLQATNSKHYVNSFIIPRRNWEKLFDLGFIKDNVITKSSDSYKNYDYSLVSEEEEQYMGKGYVASNLSIYDWNYFQNDSRLVCDVNAISDDWKKDLNRIIDYCEKNELPLTFVCTPVSNYDIVGVGNYDDYIQYVKSIADNKGIDFYDFNLCKEKYFPNASELFCDDNHLNKKGSELFSFLFSKLIKGELSTDDLFYNSCVEKINNIDLTLFGISYSDITVGDGTVIRNYRIITNGDSNIEYKVIVFSPDGEVDLLRDYSVDTSFSIPPKESRMCLVEYKNLLDDNIYGSSWFMIDR